MKHTTTAHIATAHIEKYGHGGDLWTAEETLGVPKEELLDFSANINPLGPPASVWQAIQEGLSSITAYPDPKSRALKEAIANLLPVQKEQVIVGNGAAELLYGILRALRPRTVGLLQPCFSEYAEAADVVGADIVSVYAREEADFLPERVELLEMCERVDLCIIGHPNNPNGRLLPIEWLCEMAEVLGKREKHLLVDEAFVDFLGEERSLLSINNIPSNVILCRSATKCFAIPGLRLGYAFAERDLASAIERELPPWGVNSLASRAGIAGVQDHNFIEETKRWLASERPFLVEQLRAMPGMKVYHGEVNFVLFRNALPDLQGKVGRQGVLIRSCAEYPGLGPGFYRVAVRSREENLRLLEALRTALQPALEAETVSQKGGEPPCPSFS